MAHTAPSCHKEELLLGHLPHRSVENRFQNQHHVSATQSLNLMPQKVARMQIGILTCCGSVAASL